ncbi:(2Fe-2S)-binding protein [Paractinoplanes maris]|uniref:(2Fe-2S)-binding protein n=1 Tax=Paractinoplanes maris TaxID=1734446 RepID=UPI002021627A|nr:(2Fe-2S)-binding protein [Actinoplanes maris]
MPGPEVDAGPALEAAALLGPYFAWQPHRPDPADRAGRLPCSADAGWRPMSDLLDPEVVAERVAAGRRTLCRMSGLGPEAIEERVVASTIFLQLASRLVSPLVAAASVHGALPVADPARLWWQPVEGGPMPIAYGGLSAVACAGWDAAEVAEAFTRTEIRALVEPVLEVFRERFRLSPQVLWGNVASALGGAAGMIAGNAPGFAERSAAVVAAVLAVPPLTGTAALIRPDPTRARWFLVRHNCCLYYRIPGGGTCGDCVLIPEDARRRHWQAVLAR